MFDKTTTLTVTFESREGGGGGNEGIHKRNHKAESLFSEWPFYVGILKSPPLPSPPTTPSLRKLQYQT